MFRRRRRRRRIVDRWSKHVRLFRAFGISRESNSKSSETKRILFFFLFSFLFGQVPKMLRALGSLVFRGCLPTHSHARMGVEVQPTTDEQTHADDGEIIFGSFLSFFYMTD